MDQPLWTPTQAQIDNAVLTKFSGYVNERFSAGVENSDDLHAFSVERMEDFWVAVRDYFKLKAETWGERILIDGDKMPGARFFPDAKLNYAENLLVGSGGGDAIVFRSETGATRRMSWAELRAAVSRLQQYLKAQGVGEGDRVAGYLPNFPEAVIAMLAAASLGAVWSSTSPDFGVQGVLDRFGQIGPKVLFVTDGYHYNGKYHDMTARNAEILDRLPTVRTVVVAPYSGGAPAPGASNPANAVSLASAVKPYEAKAVEYTRVSAQAPLYVMFSSGTTGAPKCMVHSVGGTLLKLATEYYLHNDLGPGDRLFFFTTCGWMMWNWMAGALMCGATLLLFDGAPSYPEMDALFTFADEEGMTYFGTSAKFIDALMKAETAPAETHDLSSLKIMASTGSPLSPEGFRYVYEKIKKDIHLVSFTGGTDIMGIFAGGDPTKPMRGEIQRAAFGIDLRCFNDEGEPVLQEKGELVCCKPFPSMPVEFLNDPDGARYRSAYFERFPNIWTHGDYMEITEHGGVVMYGRSDATLNPGGVRIGTAEIYRQVERLDEVIESLVIGQDWDNDVRVVLFVRLADGVTLDEALAGKIKTHVRTNCTPRHMPAKVVAVTDIPRTKSGKITELAVRDVVHGRAVKNKEALANPEALKLYENLAELRS